MMDNNEKQDTLKDSFEILISSSLKSIEDLEPFISKEGKDHYVGIALKNIKLLKETYWRLEAELSKNKDTLDRIELELKNGKELFFEDEFYIMSNSLLTYSSENIRDLMDKVIKAG